MLRVTAQVGPEAHSDFRIPANLGSFVALSYIHGRNLMGLRGSEGLQVFVFIHTYYLSCSGKAGPSLAFTLRNVTFRRFYSPKSISTCITTY